MPCEQFRIIGSPVRWWLAGLQKPFGKGHLPIVHEAVVIGVIGWDNLEEHHLVFGIGCGEGDAAFGRDVARDHQVWIETCERNGLGLRTGNDLEGSERDRSAVRGKLERLRIDAEHAGIVRRDGKDRIATRRRVSD